jgi:hypothetical protein
MQPVGLFTSARAELTAEAPNLPALRADGLRDWLRSEGRKPNLEPAVRRALETALDEIAADRLGTAEAAAAQARAAEAARVRAAEKSAKDARAKEEARAEKRARARERADQRPKSGR